MVGVGSAAVAVSSFATRLARDCHQHCQCNGNRSEKARPPGCAPALTTQAIPVAIGTASICTLERRAQKLRSCMFPAGLRDCIIDSLLRLHRAWLQLLFWPRRRSSGPAAALLAPQLLFWPRSHARSYLWVDGDARWRLAAH